MKATIKRWLRELSEIEPAHDCPPTDRRPEEYFIKPGYTARAKPEYFDDATPDTLKKVYQPDVYTLASAMAAVGGRRIVDVGCGRGGKLKALAEAFEVTGIDFGANIEYCRTTHPFGRWLEFDLEAESGFPLDGVDLTGSVVICADVIEHLVSPLPLLRHLKGCVDRGACLLLSTPERELLPRGRPQGPPKNPAHVREWSLGELRLLLASVGFPIQYLGLTASNNVTRHMTTMLAVLYRGPGTPGGR